MMIASNGFADFGSVEAERLGDERGAHARAATDNVRVFGAPLAPPIRA